MAEGVRIIRYPDRAAQATPVPVSSGGATAFGFYLDYVGSHGFYSSWNDVQFPSDGLAHITINARFEGVSDYSRLQIGGSMAGHHLPIAENEYGLNSPVDVTMSCTYVIPVVAGVNTIETVASSNQYLDSVSGWVSIIHATAGVTDHPMQVS